MKVKIILFCFFIGLTFNVKSQSYVTIPDPDFVSFLQANFPSCMSGNLMDTTCTGITTDTILSLDLMSISDLDGIQYFHNLRKLYCYHNSLTYLPALPRTLRLLRCGSNHITSLPTLPDTLQFFSCEDNNLTSLPVLPNTLLTISCSFNPLHSLPSLPSALMSLMCTDDSLTSLPPLPSNLQGLFCGYNQLTTIPVLSPPLHQFDCSYNNITILPPIPNSVGQLKCTKNLLTSLPALPYLYELRCDSNNIVCLPVLPFTLIDSSNIKISGNPFTCLPNYVPGMNSAMLSYPLCIVGDTIYNAGGCTQSQGIAGFTYADTDSNCTRDTLDFSVINASEKIYNSSGVLISQTFSAINGVYFFSEPAGTYTVEVDTAGTPFKSQCPFSGIDSTIILTSANPLATNVNFDIDCKSGFDIGVRSIVHENWIFPGEEHSIRIVAGDLSHWYNLNCASGVAGQLKLTVTGPVIFDSIITGSLAPSVISGNVFTYNVSDFGSLDINNAFGLLFTTDTSAIAGDTICVNAIITPTVGDNDTLNNSMTFCYYVSNSHDPNMKEVYPGNVLPGFTDWLTYTIHFQNTGSASAMNIRVADTLDNNLDLSTFQLMSYDHSNITTLTGRDLAIRFPGIMLPDSSANPEGSRGFIQYRVKPKPGLPAGTQIHNTADIYFDYNSPIVTNTTANLFTSTASINEKVLQESISVFPNPGNGIYNIKLSENVIVADFNIEVYNLFGEKILNFKVRKNVSQIDLSAQPNGVYLVRVQNRDQSQTQRMIKK